MNHLRFALGSLTSLLRLGDPIWSVGSSAHPSCHAGLGWHRGHRERSAHGTNFSKCQRWSLWSRGGVGGGLGRRPCCQTMEAVRGSPGLCSRGTGSAAAPGQPVRRCRAGGDRVSWRWLFFGLSLYHLWAVALTGEPATLSTQNR